MVVATFGPSRICRKDARTPRRPSDFRDAGPEKAKETAQSLISCGFRTSAEFAFIGMHNEVARFLSRQSLVPPTIGIRHDHCTAVSNIFRRDIRWVR